MKCLSRDKIGLAKGNIVHDSHAEILAIRAFNRWIVDECHDLAGGIGESEWLTWRRSRQAKGREAGRDEKCENAGPPFAIKDGVSIHLYISEAPCGDSSMELVMRGQADATPWASRPPSDPPPSDGVASNNHPSAAMLGRGHFDQLGIVRRKPSRPDAPVTTSKSCTDKLALKQCTGLLSGLTSRLVHPGNTYLSSLVLPSSQVVPEALDRAFGATGRMQLVTEPSVRGEWHRAGYAFRPFEVRGTSIEWEYSKRVLGEDAVPSNLSAVDTGEAQEILINGALQGRKQGDPRGASLVSRRKMWESVKEVLDTVGEGETLAGRTYAEVKMNEALSRRERVKADVRTLALNGWVRGEGDEQWTLHGDDGQ